MDRGIKWYEYQPDRVLETDKIKVLWGFNIPSNHVKEARRPAIVVVEKDKSLCKIIDVAKLAGDCRVALKEREKLRNNKRSQACDSNHMGYGETGGDTCCCRSFWNNLKMSR